VVRVGIWIQPRSELIHLNDCREARTVCWYDSYPDSYRKQLMIIKNSEKVFSPICCRKNTIKYLQYNHRTKECELLKVKFPQPNSTNIYAAAETDCPTPPCPLTGGSLVFKRPPYSFALDSQPKNSFPQSFFVLTASLHGTSSRPQSIEP